MKSEFLHENGLKYLNHGSFGATPRRIIDHQRKLQDALEAHPVRFMSETYPKAYKTALEPIAQFLGTQAQNIAFVTNATTGVATVLQSLPLSSGDELLCTSHRYEAVYNSLAYQVRLRGAKLVECILEDLAPSDESLLEAIQSKISPRTKLIMIDAISSITAHEFNISMVIEFAHKHGIPVMVDGAHSPGQHLVELDKMGADFWTGNLHKWLCSPKGCAVLYSSPRWQSTIHAPIPSHGFEQGWQEELGWMGTFDPTAWLCAPISLTQWEDWGGWGFVNKNIEQQRWATDLLLKNIKGAMASTTDQLSMRSIILPIPSSERDHLYNFLQTEYQTDVFLHPWKDNLIIRLSAFSAYTTQHDFEVLVQGLKDYLIKFN